MSDLRNSGSCKHAVLPKGHTGPTEIGSGIDGVVSGFIGHDLLFNGVRDANVSEGAECRAAHVTIMR